MLNSFSGLDPWVSVGLILALAFVLSFEFINGFHDTANAVVTVIYTRAIPPYLAVAISGIFNFLGVLLGGVGIAYAIVHLLPVELLINVNSGRGMVMVFAMLSSAIAWNLGTWVLCIPASSSHTLIGSIVGVGWANALLTNLSISQGINWDKAIDVGLSLIVTPLASFVIAAVILRVFQHLLPYSRMHRTPEERLVIDSKDHPPFWNRFVLISSAMGISFVHGFNDGQKGIGLIMLVLIGIMPGKFMLDLKSTAYQINCTRDAVIHLDSLYQRNAGILNAYIKTKNDVLGQQESSYSLLCDKKNAYDMAGTLIKNLDGITSYSEISSDRRIAIRRCLLCLDDTAKKIISKANLPAHEYRDLQRLRSEINVTVEYAPFWVIVAVALALGTGTLVGWRRIVLTIGEKIGNHGMTYAQAMATQITAVGSIGLANMFSLPVSTTHVLSSGVAGTMVANRNGLQRSTVRNIIAAWILTLPVTMIFSASLYWVGFRMLY